MSRAEWILGLGYLDPDGTSPNVKSDVGTRSHSSSIMLPAASGRHFWLCPRPVCIISRVSWSLIVCCHPSLWLSWVVLVGPAAFGRVAVVSCSCVHLAL